MCCPQFPPGALPHGAAGRDGLGLDGHLAVSVQLDLCGGHLRPHLHPQMLERVRKGILRNGASVTLVGVYAQGVLSDWPLAFCFHITCVCVIHIPGSAFELPASSFLRHQKLKANVTWHVLM